jgi:very-short-patch-repair endonuclease
MIVAIMSVPLSKDRSRRKAPKDRGPAYISRRDNPFKEGYRRYSEAERLEWERKAQLQNLARKSEALEALCRALLSLGIDHRREEKVKAFGQTYFIDVWCPALHIAFEADGAHHRLTRPRDRRRDEAIRQTLNCRVVRRWNRYYLTGDLKRKILIIIAEDEKHAFS